MNHSCMRKKLMDVGKKVMKNRMSENEQNEQVMNEQNVLNLMESAYFWYNA